MTASVVGAISPKLEQAEIERTRRKPTENLDAYDYYLRGLAGLYRLTKEGNDEALFNFHRAIELDTNFAMAYGLAARCYVQRRACGWITDFPSAVAEAARLARRAAELGQDDAVALGTAGFGLSFVADDMEFGEALIEQALMLNPNLAWLWLFSGWVKATSGEPELAIEHLTRAMRMSPNDPQRFSMYTALAVAHFVAGRYTQALTFAQAGVRSFPEFLLIRCIAAGSAALAGRREEAQIAIHSVRRLDPDLRICNLQRVLPFRRPEDYAKWEQGLRLAGLPE
jgi:tetratricopeptide (TPR) repeat protein